MGSPRSAQRCHKGKRPKRGDLGKGVGRLDQEPLELFRVDGLGKGAQRVVQIVLIKEGCAGESIGAQPAHLGQVIILLAVHEFLQHDRTVDAQPIHVRQGTLIGAEAVVE